MVIHKGKVLLSMGDVSRRFMTHSIRKSFMSALYGIYVEKGDINLYKTLKELNINDKLGLTERERSARVMDLITARSGIYHPAAYEPRSMKTNRPERGKSRPGENFFYNNWDFNTLLPILEQEAQIKFFEEFYNQIANPIGMEDLRKQDMRYRIEPDLSNHPAYLFKMSTRDMARFGQLYLNRGNWKGVQIVPEQWVDRSTTIYTHNPQGFAQRGGYGYLWWVDNKSFEQPAYYASGLGGHRLYVLPESDMVIVHRSNTYLNIYADSDNIEQLIKLVLDAKTNQASIKPSLEPLKTEKRLVANYKISEKEFSKYKGTYNHPFFGDISVSSRTGEYHVTGEILGDFRIFAQAKNRFEIEDLPELPMVFQKSSVENPRGKAITKVNERRIPVEFVLYY